MDKKILTAGVALFICITAYFYVNRTQEESISAFYDKDISKEEILNDLEDISIEEEAPAMAPDEQKTIQVYICGEIKNPGVYELMPEQRLSQLVELGGGFTKNAAPEALNLARKLEDGEKIYVYSKEEYKEGKEPYLNSPKEEAESSLVNINKAGAEGLMTLPGIGRSKAEGIIKYRETNGPFKAIEDIMNIEGIKSGVFEKIKDYITV